MVQPSPEIEAIVRRLWAARTRGDLEILDGLWSASDHLLIIGSDQREWIEGSRESVMVAGKQVGEWPIEESELLRLRAFEEDKVGWAAFEERRTNANGRSSIFRRTMVLVLEAGSWKIIQSHFSAPVPNLETAGVELTKTLSELLDSIGVGDGILAKVGHKSGTTTLVFSDIVDSTQLSHEIGDVAWSQEVSKHFDALRRVVETHGGSVVKTMGDGGMYAFASASSALTAAKEMQRSVSELGDPLIQVRIGIHSGDVIESQHDYLGVTVNKAARVAAAAEPGQILVSSITAGLVSDQDFEYGDATIVELKGLPGTHDLRPLVW